VQLARELLATAVKGLGDTTYARQLEEREVELYESSRSEDDLDLNVARSSLADTLRLQSAFDPAMRLYETSLATIEPRLGRRHAMGRRVRAGFIAALTGAGKFQAALPLLKDLAVETSSSDDRRDGQYDHCLQSLGNDYFRLGQFEVAHAILSRVVVNE